MEAGLSFSALRRDSQANCLLIEPSSEVFDVQLASRLRDKSRRNPVVKSARPLESKWISKRPLCRTAGMPTFFGARERSNRLVVQQNQQFPMLTTGFRCSPTLVMSGIQPIVRGLPATLLSEIIVPKTLRHSRQTKLGFLTVLWNSARFCVAGVFGHDSKLKLIAAFCCIS